MALLLGFGTMLRTAFQPTRIVLFEDRGGSLSSRCESTMMCPGEDLNYEVSWWIFKLGRIRLKTLESKPLDGTIRHTAVAFVDSYEGLPFVDVHAIDYSEMDSAFFPRKFRSVEKKNHEWYVENCRYDFPNRVLVIEKSWQKDLQSPTYTTPQCDTIALEHPAYLDGLSMLYYARAHVHRSMTLSVPTIVYAKKGSITFHFSGRKSTEEVDAVAKPVRVVELEGKADFEGIFGLTGDFKGWFSDDSAAVPIKAKMKVILGSVNIELKQWDRNGWSPPLDKVTK
jgi:hypothetical protein